MAKNYMGVNLTGRSLMHYRTKGSRNGYSKDPNYRPTGQRATGRLVNGRYVYDAQQQGAKNDWQQRGNLHRTVRDISVKFEQGRTAGFAAMGPENAAKVRGDTDSYTRGTDQWRYDPSYANASARVAAGKRVTTPQRTQVASAKSKRDKAIAKGAANNWQQQAAAEANSHMQRNRLVEGKARSYAIAPKSLNGKVITVENNNPRKITKQLKTQKAPYVSKEYQEELAYNSKKNVYPGQSTKPGINYANDARFQRSETQNKVINEAMKQKDAQFRAAGIPSDQKFDAAYRRGVENEVARSVPDKIQEAEAIGRYKQANKSKADIKAEQKRIKQGQKAKEKREREAKINKMKNAILSVFKKKK